MEYSFKFPLILGFTLIFFFSSTSICQNCPVPSKYSDIFNACVEARAEALPYEESERACIDNFGEIISIHNAFENTAVAELAKNYGQNGRIFIGLQKYGNAWSWSASGELDYVKWGGGEPKKGNCAVMDSADSSWHTVDCEQPFGRICVLEPKTCYDDWSYYPVTDFCYYHGFNKTFNDAEDFCQTFDGHLASIHSNDENQYIKDLTYSKECLTSVNGYNQGTTVLGGQLAANNKTAFWVDETEADYTGITCYHGGEPNTILMNSFPADCGRCPDGIWWISFADQQTEIYPDFVCKVMPFEGAKQRKTARNLK
ncbi:unnamed protein product, partial [Mesorhabditis belari]|uniref:C-type lectin domain-containing protein n=1 Tax=Mesorhabditis belari TaxID=2138241 RepID=A0AAF3FFE9_9BILA